MRRLIDVREKPRWNFNVEKRSKGAIFLHEGERPLVKPFLIP
jgi:hypothetical protein